MGKHKVCANVPLNVWHALVEALGFGWTEYPKDEYLHDGGVLNVLIGDTAFTPSIPLHFPENVEFVWTEIPEAA